MSRISNQSLSPQSIRFWAIRFFVALPAVAVLSLSACSFGQVEKASPVAYQGLPQAVQSGNVSEYQAKIRVADGKIAKIRTDLRETEEEIKVADKDIDARLTEVKNVKQTLREMKKRKAPQIEIDGGKRDVKMAKHQLKIAEEVQALKQKQRTTLLRQIDVHEAEKKVFQSHIELEKVVAVHEYTDYKVRNSKLEVANFREQLRKFEVRESEARHRLSRAEMRKAEAEYQVRILEETDIFKDDRG